MVLEDNIEIRPMHKDDLKSVFAIEIDAHRAPWTKQILNDCIEVGYDCHVMLDEDKIVAYTIFQLEKEECHIFNICVKQNRQRKGYGEKLVKFIIAKAQANEIKQVMLEVSSANTAAIKLYEKLRFQKTGLRKGYYPVPGGREDAITLARRLL